MQTQKFKLSTLFLVALFALIHAVDAAPYDISAPASPVIYSAAQKDAQRAAGQKLVAQIATAITAQQGSLTVSPGVYRLDKSLHFRGAKNFTLNAQGVEFLIGKDALFDLQNCQNVAFIGPAKVDAETYPLMQGIIRAFDANSGLASVEILPGYEIGDVEKGTLDAFSPQGVYLENPSWATFQNLNVSDAAQRLVQVTLPHDEAARRVYRPGNLLALRIHNSDNLIVSRDTDGFTLRDFEVYTSSGIGWGGGTGDWKFIDIKGIRRPGTNRLMGAGEMQMSSSGGTVLVENCEFSSTTDDVMDYSGGAGTFMALKPETPRQIITWRGQYQVGDTLNFYDHNDLGFIGAAQVLEVEELKDNALQVLARDVVKNINKGREMDVDQSLHRVTLNQGVQVLAGNFVENATSYRAEQFTIRNTYFHDCAVRVMVQGFKHGLFENNVFERISGGLSMTVDTWWWGGPTVQDVTIRNNIFQQTTFRDGWGTGRAAIAIGADKAPNRPAKNGLTHKVLIEGNQIFDSSRGAIFVDNASDVTIKNNLIQNAQSLKGESAIALNGVYQGAVTNNSISKSGAGAIAISNSTGVQVAHNAVGTAAVEIKMSENCVKMQ